LNYTSEALKKAKNEEEKEKIKKENEEIVAVSSQSGSYRF